MEKGMEKGEKKEASRMLRRMLRARFGPLTEETEQKISEASAERIEEWGERLVQADSLADVFAD